MYLGSQKKVGAYTFGGLGSIDWNKLTRPSSLVYFTDYTLTGFAKHDKILTLSRDFSLDFTLYASLLTLPKYTLGSVVYNENLLVKLTPEISSTFSYDYYGLSGELSASVYIYTGGVHQETVESSDVLTRSLSATSGFVSRLDVTKKLTTSTSIELHAHADTNKQLSAGIALKLAL